MSSLRLDVAIGVAVRLSPVRGQRARWFACGLLCAQEEKGGEISRLRVTIKKRRDRDPGKAPMSKRGKSPCAGFVEPRVMGMPANRPCLDQSMWSSCGGGIPLLWPYRDHPLVRVLSAFLTGGHLEELFQENGGWALRRTAVAHQHADRSSHPHAHAGHSHCMVIADPAHRHHRARPVGPQVVVRGLTRHRRFSAGRRRRLRERRPPGRHDS